MSFFRSLLERRSHPATPEKWLVDWFGGGSPSTAGITVSPESSLRLTTVLACVRVIAESVGSLPFLTYRRLAGGGKERDPSHPLFFLLHDQPNPWQTAMEFIEMMTGHAVLRGNGYAEIVGSPGSAIDALVPLHPDRVRVKVYSPGKVAYEYTPPVGPMRTLMPGEVLHLRGFGSDGYVGYSPIDLAREAVGLGLAAEEFGARFFGNNAVPSGVIEQSKQMSPEAKERFQKSWRDNYGQGGKKGTAVLEDGMTYKVIGIPLDHAQFLETRKFQNEEICRLFRVPLHKVQSVDHATNNNIEQQSLDFLIDTLRPWLVRWEQATKRDLFLDEWRTSHTVEFLVDALLRGDSMSRAQALQIQRQNGVVNADEWREIENRNPIADGSGKKYLVNSAMVSPDQAAAPKPAPAKDPATRSVALSAAGVRSGFRRMLEDAMGRVARREAQLLEKRGAKSPAAALEGHAEYITRTMEPVFAAFADCLRHEGTEERAAQFVRTYVASWAVRRVDLVTRGGVPPVQDEVALFEAALSGALAPMAA